MSGEKRIPDVYGPGTFTDKTFVPVPQDTERIFRLLASQTPGFTQDEKLLSKVKFTGEEYSALPGPIKAVPVAAALHAMTGVVADEILAIRGFENKKREIIVNTTHTTFWLGFVITAFIDGKDFITLTKAGKIKNLVPEWERGRWVGTPLQFRATGLYPTSEPNVWYSLHGSMDASPVLKSIGIDPSQNIKTKEEAAALITKHTSNLSPEKLEFNNLMNGFCGSVVFTPKQWRESEIGKSLDNHPLINVKAQLHAIPTPPVAFPPLNPNDKRPLAGVKIIEMTRVIAGPKIGTILSSYGADIIRVNAPHLPDIDAFQLTLNVGKRTIAIDMRNPEEAALLKSLVAEADVFIQGFRLNKMPKFGLGINDLLKMAGERGRGIVYTSENCYGPDGYYAERPGWQQIADCCAGSAYVTGQSLELPNNEAVLPSLPISDMSTGVVGALETMMALRERATKGGSYVTHAALAAINAYALKPEIGLYPKATVAECAKRFKWAEMRGSHHVLDLLVTVWDGWKRVFGDYLHENSGWFQTFENSAFGGHRLSLLKPVVELSDDEKFVEWRSPSVPYGFEKATDVKFQ